jgi:hypothetical protein
MPYRETFYDVLIKEKKITIAVLAKFIRKEVTILLKIKCAEKYLKIESLHI